MQGFRFEPTTARPSRVVARPRLQRLLTGRFDHRVTIVTGAAGYGKTTALALAIENNRLDPYGIDIWLGARPSDDVPAALLDGIVRSLGQEPNAGSPASIERICDAVWALAPDDVAITIDDAHHLLSAPARSTIVDLVDALPANGHLVISSRHDLQLSLADLTTPPEVLTIGEDQLRLDDHELLALCNHRGADTRAPLTDLPRHAATADLQLLAGSDASTDFLWEEILSALDVDRLATLQRAAVFEEVDDELVDELSDGTFDAAALVADLPLVEVLERSVRLHALLREALLGRWSPAARRAATIAAAEIERRRGNFRDAVGLFLAVGDLGAVRDIARASVFRPPTAQNPGESTAIMRALRNADAPPSLLGACELADDGIIGPTMINRFQRCADQARVDGDAELEALLLFRTGQSILVSHDLPSERVLDRLDELAERVPSVRSLHSHLMSILLQFEHDDADGALALLDDLDGLDSLGPDLAAAMRCERLFDLGRMEDVDRGLPIHDFSLLPTGAEGYVVLAMWLRGDIAPDAAAALSAGSVADALRHTGPHTQLATLAAGTLSALATGDSAAARLRSGRAAEIAHEPVVGQGARLWSAIASASVAAVLDGDEAAASDRLDPATTGAVVDVFPYQSYLASLALLYVVRPETRPALDRCSVGPALTTAIAAGRAVIELRDHDDARTATSLPWTQAALLRNNVLPTHLAELSCAVLAADPEHAAARAVFDALPHQADLLRWVAEHAGATAARHAASLLSEHPAHPDRTLHVRLLGEAEVVLDGETLTATEWTRRPKVRELLALIIDRRRVSRSDIVDELWPGNTDLDKAYGNLRSTLNLLQRVLEPDRPADQPSSFVYADDQFLVASDQITTDIDEFELLVEQAQADDEAGFPARALQHHLAAIERYRGDFLDDIDSAWALLPRLRLQSAAVRSMCRAAELLAAKGEPETAMLLAERTRTIDPLNERAARQLIGALAATGNVTSARSAAEHIVEQFRFAGLDIAGDLERTITHLGLSVN